MSLVGSSRRSDVFTGAFIALFYGIIALIGAMAALVFIFAMGRGHA